VPAAGGKVGGFSAPGGAAMKIRMLELEGVRVRRLSRFSAPSGSEDTLPETCVNLQELRDHVTDDAVHAPWRR